MTAVLSSTHVWVMVDHKPRTQSCKDHHYPVTLYLLSKNILSKHFCPWFLLSQLFNYWEVYFKR